MRGPQIGAVTLLLVTLAVPTPAATSGGCGDVTTIALGVEIIYIDDRSAESSNPEDVWIYEESNGVPGLQTGHWFALLPDEDATSTFINHVMFGYDPCATYGPQGPDTRLRYSML